MSSHFDITLRFQITSIHLYIFTELHSPNSLLKITYMTYAVLGIRKASAGLVSSCDLSTQEAEAGGLRV
jgi:hypothetical protein